MSIRCKLRSRGGGHNADELCLKAFELIKELDSKIEFLEKENIKFKKLSELNYNIGLRQGQSDAKHCFERAAKAKEEYLEENQQLTNLLLKTEEELDILRKSLSSNTD